MGHITGPKWGHLPTQAVTPAMIPLCDPRSGTGGDTRSCRTSLRTKAGDAGQAASVPQDTGSSPGDPETSDSMVAEASCNFEASYPFLIASPTIMKAIASER